MENPGKRWEKAGLLGNSAICEKIASLILTARDKDRQAAVHLQNVLDRMV